MEKRATCAVVCFCVALPGCGGLVIMEQGPDPWGASDGEAAPLPDSGNAPKDPPGSSEELAWSGWWVRFPTNSAVPGDIAALGEDVIVLGVDLAGQLDLGFGLLAPDLPSGDWVNFLARISADGEVVWAQIVASGGTDRIAIDTSSRIYVPIRDGLSVYDASGALLQDRIFGEDVGVDALAPTSDGGLLLGLQPLGPLDLGAGPVPLTDEGPVGVLVRLDADGAPVWHREVTGAVGFTGVGEDGAGNVIAATLGASYADWGDVELDGGNDPETTFAVSFASDGTAALSATVVHGARTGPRAVATKVPGILISGGATGPLTVQGADVPYGSTGKYDEKGVILRINDEGALESLVTLGAGDCSVSAGPQRMFVASTIQHDPLQLLWCADGAEPCARFSVAETEATWDRVAMTATGSAAFMAGQVRPTPGGALTEKSQLYVMKLAPKP